MYRTYLVVLFAAGVRLGVEREAESSGACGMVEVLKKRQENYFNRLIDKIC